MPAGRRLLLSLFLALGSLAAAGCEPYMSMTDQIPAETRRAVALLPETPGYVGMVDMQTILTQLDDLQGANWADSLRQTENPHLRAFLDATGLDPARDVQAAYGAIEGNDGFSGVLFASLAPAQLDRYLERAPARSGRRTTYRDVPLYHLSLGGGETSRDTLSVAFLEEDLLAVSTRADRVTAMVDRHWAEEPTGLAANRDYMTLVERVGHGSTAWLVGRDVVQTALQDSADVGEQEKPSSAASRVSQAGLQRALATWTDRVLGLSKVSSFGGRTGGKVGRLKRRLRDQALSVTLTETALEGQVYLTMRDNASASSVVDVAEGAVAMMRLSADDLSAQQRDLLDEIQIDRDGAIVHIQFAVDRAQIRDRLRSAPPNRAAHQANPTIRQPRVATHRLGSIKRARAALQPAQSMGGATHPEKRLSTRTTRTVRVR
jgi:hypothetical protein